MIKVTNLSKSYGDNKVLDNISFSIDEPEIVALVGPNGVGKSTLLNAMVNQLDVDSGEVLLCGKSPKDVSIFNDVSFLRDNTVLYSYMTGLDHLSYAAGIYGTNKSRINEVIEIVGIEGFVNDRVQSYSLGMKQQLLIALVILNDPKLIIMDEPLNGLDPSRIIFVRNLLRDLVNQGKTILMSSHTLSEVDMLTNHILFIKEGKLLEEYLDGSQSSEERYSSLYMN